MAHTSDTSTLLSTTGGFVASATGLAVKQGILIARGGVKYVRFLTTVSTTNLAWAPALPTAVVGDEVVKGCVTYKPYTPTAAPYAISLFAAHYLTADTTRSKMLKGLVLSKLTEQFEQGKEGTFTMSGPAKTRTVATAKPAAFTTVGSANPPSGLVGELVVSGAAYKFIKLNWEMDCGRALRMDSYGFTNGEEALPPPRRLTTVALEAKAWDEAPLVTPAEAGTYVDILKQTGRTEGNIRAIYWPKVEFVPPDEDDGDDAPIWPFRGIACESADGADDEVLLAYA